MKFPPTFRPPGRRRRPIALGAYIFAGGFTVGVSRVFDVLAHLEETNYGVATFKHNMPDIPVHFPPDTWPLDELKDEAPAIDFLYGNPPCAAWSPAGSTIGRERDWTTDPRVDCTRRSFGLLEWFRPTVWAWESVPQAFSTGRPFVDELTRRAIDLGYSVTYLLHNAMYVGAPQRRRRFFFVAHKVKFDVADLNWSFITCDEALRGLNDPGEPLDHNIKKYPWLIPKVKPNETLSHAWERLTPKPWALNPRGHVVGRPCFTIKRLEAGQPAPVVMHELVHPTEDRAISIKEMAMLCGYPPEYEFIGARDAGQIGRGVCPPVGEWLAKNVARCLKRGEAYQEPIVQMIDVTEPPMKITSLPYPELGKEPKPMPRVAKTVTTVTPVADAPTPPREPTEGSGVYIRRLLVQGFSTDAILAAVHAQFPGSKAGVSDVAWNRGKLKRELSPGQVLAGPHGVVGTALKPNGAAQHDLPFDVDESAKTNKQPSRVRQSVDPDREFDKTSLRANSHGQWIHRDYGAHFFRWGWAGRFVTGETDVLDVGCGVDVPMINVLTMPRNQVPKSYTGVDLNNEPHKAPSRQWATLKWGFNFLKDHKKLGQFDLITCFEMIEHMSAEDGAKLLKALKTCLRPGGKLLLSTPVFNGKAAANHLHEYTIAELDVAIRKAGMVAVQRFGTFASSKDIKKVATKDELALITKLGVYYSGEVMSCFIAPLYPDTSRNNVWLITL